MNVLLLGEKGYLGSYLYEKLKVDTLETRELYNNGKIYNYVINCIGKPNLEYCEIHKEETDYSNRDVIKDIKKYYPTSKIINFSSYYVYNDDGMCNEESKVTYKYNYTKQKLEGEQLINNGVSFRVGKLFGHPLNNQQKLTEYILNNDNLTLDNVYFNPTSLNQVLQVIKWELENNKLNGIFNLSNNGVTTHYEYGVFINNILQTNKNIVQTNKLERQFDNYGKFLMSCNKLKQFVPLVSWKEDMMDYLK
jgi:dTDP-4-dehydrorhamnose reductase